MVVKTLGMTGCLNGDEHHSHFSMKWITIVFSFFQLKLLFRKRMLAVGKNEPRVKVAATLW